MRDSCYLVSVTADREHRLTETHENDNVAYALIKVAERGTGDVVRETGGRASPWDRRGTVVPDPVLCSDLLRDPASNPEHCSHTTCGSRRSQHTLTAAEAILAVGVDAIAP
jgi:hypothetical protein